MQTCQEEMSHSECMHLGCHPPRRLQRWLGGFCSVQGVAFRFDQYRFQIPLRSWHPQRCSKGTWRYHQGDCIDIIGRPEQLDTLRSIVFIERMRSHQSTQTALFPLNGLIPSSTAHPSREVQPVCKLTEFTLVVMQSTRTTFSRFLHSDCSSKCHSTSWRDHTA